MLFSSPFFSLQSFISTGGIVILLSSTHHLVLSRSCNFSFLIRLAGVSCFHSSSLILSSFASFLNRRAVWNPSYPLCHSFNSSRGSVLLISSSIIPSSQVHVQFLPFTVGVLPNYIILIHSYLVSTRVVSIPSCPLCSSFMSLQPSSYRNVPCSSFLTDCLQSRSSLIAQPLKVHWFHSFVKEAT